MEHYKLVLPEHMNDQGNLFGGYLLKWIDEVAYITVSSDYPGRRFVTISLDHVTFKHAIACGEILRFDVQQCKMGRSSATYAVKVYGAKTCQISEGQDCDSLFETQISFVNVSPEGKPQPIQA